MIRAGCRASRYVERRTGPSRKATASSSQRHLGRRTWRIRELGTVEKLDSTGHLQLRLDSGRAVTFKVDHHPHLDYGYAVTSHSSQGQTTDRVLVHVDTERAREKLVNQRLAYVALSRGRYDARIYTNDKTHLGDTLSREVSQRSALEPSVAPESPSEKIEPSSARRRATEQAITRSARG